MSDSTEKITWTLEKRNIKDLVKNPKNPRKLSKFQAQNLKKSLDHFGQAEPIIINPDNFIIGGHQRVKTLQSLGYKEVDVSIPSRPLTEKEVDELGIRLNKNTGDWDFDLLANFYEPRDLLDYGFTEDELQCDVDVLEGKEPDDSAPELPKNPQTKPGDLYLLGPHKLLCGDCRNPEHVEKLLDDVLVAMLCTDPPYGVDYSKKSEHMKKFRPSKNTHKDIASDVGENYRQFFAEFLSLIPWAEKNTAYICMSGQELHNLRLATEDCGMKWGDYLIWVKNHLVLGRKDYNAKHEFVYYGWKGTHKFYGPTNSVTTLEFDKPQSSKEHPTMKPIALIRRLVEDGSEADASVYDPFCGSGTTLLACEQEPTRRCFALEISPQYCDVIVSRWRKYKKDQGHLYQIIRNGEPIIWEDKNG